MSYPHPLRPASQLNSFIRTRLLRLLVPVALLGFAFGSGCQSRQERTKVENGRAAFARICASCHGFDGKGGMRAGFNPPPRDLTDPAFQDSVTDEQILTTLRNGKGQMPPFAALLPENEQQELLAFVRSLERKSP